jgi:hypothetical protein
LANILVSIVVDIGVNIVADDATPTGGGLAVGVRFAGVEG